MEASFKQTTTDKRERYEHFLEQFAPLIEGEKDEISILANTSAALKEAFGFFWVGFYLVRHDELVLGPFQGKSACIEIPCGRGVCGTALAKNETQLVYDVHQFPGHIACDSASNSEIVVPLRKGGQVVAVLDIDSPSIGRFDEDDRDGLEQVAKIIEKCF